MLEPGNQRLQISLDGEPALHDLGNVTLISLDRQGLQLLSRWVAVDAP
jgi:hypothetical protein